MKNDLGSLPDLVGRAAALLAQQAPAATALPPVTLPRAPTPPVAPPVPVEELRRRALDFVTALFASAGQPTPQPLAVASAVLPWLRSAGSAGAGQSLEIPVPIENDQQAPVDVCLYSTDLLSDQGRSIPGHLVSFEPPSLTLAPGQRATVQAKVAVPLQSIPGSYSGLVQTQGLETAKSVLTIEIT
jgi:hypothetical protein